MPVLVYRRSRPGTVLNAAVEVLAAAEHPMSPRQVHGAVEALLDRAVLRGSVKHALSSNTLGKHSGRACFERVRPGRCRLARSPHPSAVHDGRLDHPEDRDAGSSPRASVCSAMRATSSLSSLEPLFIQSKRFAGARS